MDSKSPDKVLALLRSQGINIYRLTPVAGGDINTAFRADVGNTFLFLKLNDAVRFPGMFAREREGLEALFANGSCKIPAVVSCGSDDVHQWLLLDWLEQAPAHAGSMYAFGQELAHMHQREQPWFGWHNDNYIGSLVQVNTKSTSWPVFFVECRIRPMLEKLHGAGRISSNEMEQAMQNAAIMAAVFPAEPPALLHGDLWSGNFMITKGGKAAIFDPAVYYGHREMDIGMSLLFGGFDQSFYKGYQSVYPLQPGWKNRISSALLYPLLVHAVLFGSHYISRSLKLLGI